MPRSLQSLCGRLGSLNVIAYGFGNEMACANDFRCKPPQRLLHTRPGTGGKGSAAGSRAGTPADDKGAVLRAGNSKDAALKRPHEGSSAVVGDDADDNDNALEEVGDDEACPGGGAAAPGLARETSLGGNVSIGMEKVTRKRRRSMRAQHSVPPNCQYVEVGVLDWPFVFVMTVPTVDKYGNVNMGAWENPCVGGVNTRGYRGGAGWGGAACGLWGRVRGCGGFMVCPTAMWCTGFGSKWRR